LKGFTISLKFALDTFVYISVVKLKPNHLIQ